MNFSAEDLAQAQRMMQSMSPSDIQGMMRAFQNNPALQDTVLRSMGAKSSPLAQQKAEKERGNKLFVEGNFSEAKSVYQKVIGELEKTPTDPERNTLLRQCRNNYSICALRTNHWAEARDSAELVLQTEPEDLKANWYLIEALVGLGNMEGAKTHFSRVSRIFPSRPEFDALKAKIDSVPAKEEQSVEVENQVSQKEEPPATKEDLISSISENPTRLSDVEKPAPNNPDQKTLSEEAKLSSSSVQEQVVVQEEPSGLTQQSPITAVENPASRSHKAPLIATQQPNLQNYQAESLLNRLWQLLLGVLIGLVLAKITRH